MQVFQPTLTEREWMGKILPWLVKVNPKGFSFVRYVTDNFKVKCMLQRESEKFYDEIILKIITRKKLGLFSAGYLNRICPSPFVIFRLLTSFKIMFVLPWSTLKYCLETSSFSISELVREANTNKCEFITFVEVGAWPNDIIGLDFSKFMMESWVLDREESDNKYMLRTLETLGLPADIKRLAFSIRGSPKFLRAITEKDWIDIILPRMSALQSTKGPQHRFLFCAFISNHLNMEETLPTIVLNIYNNTMSRIIEAKSDSFTAQDINLFRKICTFPKATFLILTKFHIMDMYPWNVVETDLLKSFDSFRDVILKHMHKSSFITFYDEDEWMDQYDVVDTKFEDLVMIKNDFDLEYDIATLLEKLEAHQMPEKVKQLILYPSGRERSKMNFRPRKELQESIKTEITKKDIIVDHDPTHPLFPNKKYQGVQMIVKSTSPKRNIYIPVLRVVKKAAPDNLDEEIGLYSSDEQKKEDRCGTYYYYEPDSEFLLQGKSMLVVTNKYLAVETIKSHPRTSKCKTWIESLEFIGKYLIAVDEFRARIKRGLQSENLTKTEDPNKIAELYKHGTFSREIFQSYMYATEDPFDNLLCKLAVLAELDLVLLTCMTGESRFVAEVVDTRARKVSYESLAADLYYHPSLNRTRGERGYIEWDVEEEEEEGEEKEKKEEEQSSIKKLKVQCSYTSAKSHQQCKREVICYKSSPTSAMCWQHLK